MTARHGRLEKTDICGYPFLGRGCGYNDEPDRGTPRHEALEHSEDEQEIKVGRETHEETGLAANDPVLLDVVSNVDIDEQGKVRYHYVIIDYLVHVKNLEAKAASDAADLRWVPFDEVECYNLTASFRLFFRNNRKKLEQVNSYP